MKNNISEEICQKCGACCKNHPYVEIFINEIHLLEKLTGLDLEKFINIKEKNNKEYFFKFQKNGDCFFLNNENGNHSCSVYESRPKICRNYPSTPEQIKTCKTLCKKFLTD
ncbi:MAG: YkgJ family cysteine cluster protein [bacterium]|nr:YkgJ family cysteine cluster protein [bacterium]